MQFFPDHAWLLRSIFVFGCDWFLPRSVSSIVLRLVSASQRIILSAAVQVSASPTTRERFFIRGCDDRHPRGGGVEGGVTRGIGKVAIRG